MTDKQEWRTVPVTDAMALAFHNALTDGSIGQAEVEEIKTGLRAALNAAPTTPKSEQFDRNAVIEECARICDAQGASFSASGIRALKSQPAAPDKRDEALRSVEVILKRIACFSQCDGLLWWQIEARSALAAIDDALKGGV